MAAALALRNPLDSTDLGALIASARAAAGLSQTALAAAIGTAQSVISRWERGVETPRVETLVRILRACGFEPDLVLRPSRNGSHRQPRLVAVPMSEVPRAADDEEHGRRLLEVLSLADAIPHRPRARVLRAPRLVSS
jgi:transcriptional regulator with XRE-family HTH domain